MTRLALPTLCLLALLGSGAAHGKIPPYRFASEADLTMVPGTPSLAIQVYNDSGHPVSLQVALSQPVVISPEQEKLRPLAVRYPTLNIAGGGVGQVELESPDKKQTPLTGVYSLALYAVGQPAIRKTVNFAAPQPKLGTPSAAVDSWTTQLWRVVPFTTLTVPGSGRALPLIKATESKKAEEPAATEEAKILGYLISETDTVAVVESSRTSTAFEQGLAGLELDFDGIAPLASKYDGKIGLRTSSGQQTVSLTAEVKDIIIWPILALTLGIFITRRSQIFLEVRRFTWPLREREAQLGLDFTSAQAQHKESNFDIEADLTKQRSDLRRAIDGLDNWTGQPVDNRPEYLSTSTQLEQLEEAVAAWSRFADKLSGFEKTQDRFAEQSGRLQRPPRIASGRAPACLAAARKVSAPAALTIEEFQQRRSDIAKAQILLVRWPMAEEQVMDQFDAVAELKESIPPSHQDLVQMESQAKELHAVWETLWELEQDEALTQLNEEIARIDRALSKLSKHLQHNVLATRERRNLEHARVGVDPQLKSSERITVEDESPLPPNHPPAYYARLSQRYALWVTLLAFTLALLSGLNQLYFDKPFSTPLHYINALAWGAGTTLFLDTVLAALGKIPGVASILGR